MLRGRDLPDLKRTIVIRPGGLALGDREMAWDDFTPATEGVKSWALPVIYKEPDKFTAAQEAVQAAAAKLAATVKGGDEAAVKAGVLALSDACSNCHDKFREKQ